MCVCYLHLLWHVTVTQMWHSFSVVMVFILDAPKKQKQAKLLEGIMDQMEVEEED